MKIFEQYISELQEIPLEELTEHSKRSALEFLLKDIAFKQNPKIKIQHEPRRIENYGSPDFKIFINASIIGYAENKKIDSNLNKTVRTKQIEKYKELSSNILLTNYIEFIWIKNGEIAGRETLCNISDIKNKKFKPKAEKIKKTEKIIKNFFSQAPTGIFNTSKLASELAVRSRNLRDFLYDELQHQQKYKTEGKLFALFNTFKTSVFNELTIKEFSDAFAQMLVYGLFFAKLNAGEKEINLQNAKKYISSSFQLIRELVNFLDVLEERKEYKEIIWIVEEVISIMNGLQLENIRKNLSFNENKKDPYIYFYENFLAKYDSKLRKAKGVYYTPPEVVSFIIRTINDILKQKFKIKTGLANHKKVTVLDFATGTGTFFLQVIQKIFDEIPSQSKRNLIIKEHILKNIYGFEYLIAPYTIAHLKISQFLKDNNYEMQDEERLNIFLTNTLDPVDVQRSLFLPAMSNEGKQAQAIKEKPILIITGNPPYSAASKNKGKWISDLIENYKYVDGEHFGEKRHSLQDDYVKFIRFAQHKIDNIPEGVVGIITNHSFLDNPTFRGMRQSLMKTFNQLYFIDLHGNSLKKEKTPEGNKDENIFDIKQGVAISVMIKRKGLRRGVFHSDFWGLRQRKYEKCLQANINNKNLFTKLKPNSPYYFFTQKDETNRAEYDNYWYLKDIFEKSITGIQTARDHFAIDFSKKELNKRLNKFKNLSLSDLQIIEELNIRNSRSWKINKARKEMSELENFDKNFKTILYRPFDNRIIYYHKTAVDWGRWNFMENMLACKNYALICPKQNKNDWGVFVSDNIVAHKTVSAYDINYVFPLYVIYKKNGNTNGNGYFFKNNEKRDNFTRKFRIFINEKYKIKIKPETVFGYIYAVLYSNNYRKKYLQFLKYDFPKIPFVDDIKIFKRISKIGFDLIQKHLQNEIPEGKYYEKTGIYEGEGNNIIEIINFTTGKKTGFGKIFINKNQYFDNVPKVVFNYYIGGYAVIQKFLKSKKNKTLKLDEIDEIENIIKILHYTIKQEVKISKQLQTLL